MEACGNDSSNKPVLLPMASVASCPAAANGAPPSPPRLDQAFVTGSVEGPSGRIPCVPSALTRRDRWGSIKARWGVGRMDYAVDPGLYALGSPDGGSPVLVTANYKMSFDCLREALPGRNAWILVLDTLGINVWCAAGKGTFGTEELLLRIEAAGLQNVVKHRDLILPQLGAPGVSAHLARKRSGFKVHYGPILARDLPAYLDAGLRATAKMRRKAFPLRERAVLIPIELVAALKPALVIIPLLFLISGFGGDGGFVRNVIRDGLFSLAAFLLAVFSGAVLTPLLLPYLPGRAFSAKGLAVGLTAAVLLLLTWGGDAGSRRDLLLGVAWLLLIPAFSAFLAMNFTGASTYTSLSGVRREMRWALPLEIGVGVSGFAVFLVSRFF
ncbi:MAG: mercury methylation corrinoid protein HgcA [Deltaproteobacteria bacterium]|nr:mercury methylation corrinoid protein HgcA [Deltaproteobacteria bacterium]